MGTQKTLFHIFYRDRFHQSDLSLTVLAPNATKAMGKAKKHLQIKKYDPATVKIVANDNYDPENPGKTNLNDRPAYFVYYQPYGNSNERFCRVVADNILEAETEFKARFPVQSITTMKRIRVVKPKKNRPTVYLEPIGVTPLTAKKLPIAVAAIA